MARRRSQTIRKQKTQQHETPADYTLRPDCYQHREAMTGEGAARVVVYKRVDRIEQLENAAKITRAQAIALDEYRKAYEGAHQEGCASSLSSLMNAVRSAPGSIMPSEWRLHAIENCRRIERAIPNGCEQALLAVVVNGLHWNDVAWARVPRPQSRAAQYVLGVRRNRTVRPERAEAVLRELRFAADAIAQVLRIGT